MNEQFDEDVADLGFVEEEEKLEMNGTTEEKETEEKMEEEDEGDQDSKSNNDILEDYEHW